MTCRCDQLNEKVKRVHADTPVSELQELVAEIVENESTRQLFCRCSYKYKDTINYRMCWALPSKKALDFIEKQFKALNMKRVVDMGSGSGLWSLFLRERGITVVPIDINPERFDVTYIMPTKDYQQEPDDLLLMTWGTTFTPIANFIENGGRAVIIQGESEGGCTVPFDSCSGLSLYDQISSHMPSLASKYDEGIACYT